MNMPSVPYSSPFPRPEAPSPVNFTVAAEAADQHGTDMLRAVNEVAWPTMDVDSRQEVGKIEQLVDMSLSDEERDIKQFATDYQGLTPEQQATFQAQRNALIEARAQLNRQPQPSATVKSPQSLSLLQSPDFRTYYDQLLPHQRYAVERRAHQDWVRIAHYGASALNAAGIAAPPAMPWRSIMPEMTTPSAVQQNYSNTLDDYTARQNRKNWVRAA